MRKTWRQKLSVCLLVLILVSLAVIFIYPLVFLLINSLKDKISYYADPLALPQSPSIQNYLLLFQKFGILKYIKNTLIISVFSILLTLACSVLASYAFAKLRFRGKTPAYLLIIATMFFPAQVTMIPLYVMFSKLHLVNTYLGVILVTAAAMTPSTILLLRSNFVSISDELFEAARIDGAGYFGVIWNVLVPMGMPAISISSIFNFLVVCNDLFRPMILLPNQEKRTLTVALASLLNQRMGDPTYMFAGMFISALIPLAIYIIFSKFLVKGLTVGSIK